MISSRTLSLARETAKDLRSRGDTEKAQAIEALVDASARESIAPIDFLTTTEAGEILGVTGQTIKNWIRDGRIEGFRIGGRFMVPRNAVADYVRRAGASLDLEEVSDDEAAELVAKSRTKGS
jgi:excisionase family DNA binding protein